MADDIEEKMMLERYLIDLPSSTGDRFAILCPYSIFVADLPNGDWFFNSECYVGQDRDHYYSEEAAVRAAIRYVIDRRLYLTKTNKGKKRITILGKPTAKKGKRKK